MGHVQEEKIVLLHIPRLKWISKSKLQLGFFIYIRLYKCAESKGHSNDDTLFTIGIEVVIIAKVLLWKTTLMNTRTVQYAVTGAHPILPQGDFLPVVQGITIITHNSTQQISSYLHNPILLPILLE